DAEYIELSEILDLPRYVDNYKGAPTFKLATQATLGRVLFYDTQLSEDYTVSCASCHRQEFAFADPEALSTGIYSRLTDRNSIGLGSFASFASEYGEGNGGSSAARSLFWDQRAQTVHSQMIETIANDKEMGMSMTDIVNRLYGQRHYEILFEKAFLSPQVTADGVLDALASFMQAMTADRSRFDVGKPGFGSSLFDVSHPFETFSDLENQGKSLFIENCTPCHTRSLLTSSSNGLESANNGLDQESLDPGLGGHTGEASEVGLFKIPMLRNVALTGPYMHDGRFATLEEVVDHYNSGVQSHPNLHPALIDSETGQPRQMLFNDDDKAALVAFLNTLTDMGELGTEKFSDPWLD
ncbi:MAG: cytochrome c peroxidase, partial [Saprospiraceae bacterium]|nr:cytochrome c peroxidase [Saprospiraceae bacterium]